MTLLLLIYVCIYLSMVLKASTLEQEQVFYGLCLTPPNEQALRTDKCISLFYNVKRLIFLFDVKNPSCAVTKQTCACFECPQ